MRSPASCFAWTSWLVFSLACAIVMSGCGGGAQEVSLPPPPPGKSTPVILWSAPAPIRNPTALTAAQLNATANVAGTFTYTPVAGTVLAAGAQTLSVNFVPTDSANYTNASATVSLTVNPPKTSFVYASEIYVDLTAPPGQQASQILEVFALNTTTGALTPIAGSPFSTGNGAGGDMVLSPKGDLAYVQDAVRASGVTTYSILIYSLDPVSGVPTLKQTQTLGWTGAMFMHPSGKFLYIAGQQGPTSALGIFAIQSDGTLAYLNTSQLQPAGPLAISPNGQFLATVTDGGPVNGTGNGGFDCYQEYADVWSYAIDPSSGELSLANGPNIFQYQYCPSNRGGAGFFEQFDPTGQRLFVINGDNSQINPYAIDASSGVLTPLAGPDSLSPSDATVIDPLGRFLYGGGSEYFTGVSLIAPGGGLPQVPGGSVGLNPQPTWDSSSTTMAIDSTGTFLFSNDTYYTSAFNCCWPPDSFAEFQINPMTGALTQIPSAPANLLGVATRIQVTPAQ